MNQLFSLAGKVALITGSTRGIGKEIAKGFIGAGAKVYVHGRSIEQSQAVADELGCLALAADLAQPTQIATLAEAFLVLEPQLDILVHNAGLETGRELEQLSLVDFDLVHTINLRAVIDLTQRLLPTLKKANGASVINLTSIHDTVPYYGNLAYCVSKAGLAMASKVMAIELAPFQIRVNNFAPGAVETDINRAVIEKIGRDQFAEWIPLGRVAQTSEMVGPAIFLASDASSYVTGATLYADGGYKEHLVRYRVT